MKLDEFIKQTVIEIMRSIDSSDRELRANNIGSIYRGDYKRTMAQTLATHNLVKGEGDQAVLIVDFEVAVAVQEKAEETDKVGAGVGAVLSVVGFKISGESVGSETFTSNNTHKISFSIPLAITNWGK